MSDKKHLEEYRIKKDKLRDKFPGLQKWDALQQAIKNIHQYDEAVQFIILFDSLEHEYNLLKQRNYRSKTVKEKKESRDKMILKALNLEPKVNTVKINIDIKSNLITPVTSEPSSPK
jgi:hypothetical protein